MEALVNGSFERFRGRRVLVTGHTGFKGAWLCEWLLRLGAEVTGFSLPPEPGPSLFEQLGLAGRLDSRIGDVRDAPALGACIAESRPDFVFHLAAQPLVRRSYAAPRETWETNVSGTVNLLESLRANPPPRRCAVIVVTSDKCYRNVEWEYAYRECDPLGGHDPYSASKAGAEIAVSAWRQSFFHGNHPVRVATARAGNVIGGGDWAEDRIVPDCIRALAAGNPILVRNRHARRPWQHVLEPLSGYLELAVHLHEGHGRTIDALNFGPPPASNRTVRELVEAIVSHWPGEWEDHTPADAPHEAVNLHLTIDRAWQVLAWEPRWSFDEAVAKTVEWYRRSHESDGDGGIAAFTGSQIDAFMQACAPESP